MATIVHPTAVVSTQAELGDGVVVGPYVVIDDPVTIGDNTVIGPHAVIHSHVELGSDNTIHAHAVLGDLPQDLTYRDAETWVRIGRKNIFREGTTIHRSTDPDVPTRIGSECYLMAYAHVGHNTQVGDYVILTNNVMLAGHVEIGERAVLGGNAGVHQFTRVGAYTMVAGFVAVRQDVIPFTMLGGEPVRHYRLNTVGLRRAGIKGERYRSLELAYRALREGNRELGGLAQTPEIEHLTSWLGIKSKRGIYGFARPGADADQ